MPRTSVDRSREAVRRFLNARGDFVLLLSNPLKTQITRVPPKLEKALPFWFAFLLLGEKDVYRSDEEARIDAILEFIAEKRKKAVAA